VNALDDRLRDMFRAVADTVDPTTVPNPAVRTQPQAISSRRMRFIAPFAAAAAVAVVVITTTLAAGRPGLHPHHPLAVKTRPAAAPNLPTFTLADLGSSVKVYNTRTGVAVATLAPPAGQQFQDVASGGAARTYLAATGLSGSACHAYFYRFQLSDTGQPSRLTFLRSVPDSQPTAITGIPGGHTYAYSTVRCAVAPPGFVGISGRAGNRTWDYPGADNYTFSLSATADGRTLALSYFVAYGTGSQDGLENALLNTKSSSRTADGASRVLSSIPPSPTPAISPDGRTLYTCASEGSTGTLAAYSTTTGARIRVLHQWQGVSQGFVCQVSTDPTGRFLLAAVTPDVQQPYSLIGFDLRADTSATVPVHPDLPYRGTQLAW
jgi:hypothetical protein